MTNVIRGFLKINLPLHQSVRLRHRRFNFKYLRPPSDAKALVEQVCRPVLPILEAPKPWHQTCVESVELEQLELRRKEEYTPYEILLAKEAKNRLDHAKWIAFFHKNPTEELEFLDMQVFLRRQCSMKLFEYDNKIVQKALGGTEYHPALILFQSETYFGLADDLKVKELVSNLKKLPKIILIGGIIEGRLLTRAEIEYYASLPDITILRSRLVGVINRPAQILIKHLTHHQNKLVSQLKSYQDILKKDGGQAGTSTSEAQVSSFSSSPDLASSSAIGSAISDAKDSIVDSATSAATRSAASEAKSFSSGTNDSTSDNSAATSSATSSSPDSSSGTSSTPSDAKSSSPASGTEKSDKTVLLVNKSDDTSSSSSSESSSDSSDSDSDDEKGKK